MSAAIFPDLQSPNWKLTRTPVWTTQVSTDSTGIRRRSPLQPVQLYRWTLKNAVLQSAPAIADLQTIQDFFNARSGMLDAFLWRDPEPDSTIDDVSRQIQIGGVFYRSVVFAVDTIDFERFAYQLWECGSVSFIQVGITEGLIDAATVPPVIRGSAIVSASAGSITIPFTGLDVPGGGTTSAVAGDMAVIFTGSGWPATNPAGWTNLFNDQSVSWMLLGSWKILTSGDISTGSVTVNFSNSFSCKGAIVVFNGATGGIRESQENHNAGGAPLYVINTTSSAVISSDAAIYFASVRGLTDIPVITASTGTPATLNTNASTDGTILADQGMPGGSLTVTNDFTAGGGAGVVGCQVIVRGVIP